FLVVVDNALPEIDGISCVFLQSIANFDFHIFSWRAHGRDDWRRVHWRGNQDLPLGVGKFDVFVKNNADFVSFEIDGIVRRLRAHEFWWFQILWTTSGRAAFGAGNDYPQQENKSKNMSKSFFQT